MSINISFQASKQKKLLFNKPLKQVVKNSLQSTKIQKNFNTKVQEYPTSLSIQLSECYVSPISIQFSQNNNTETLRGDVTTNIAGPGFHKNCIDFLVMLKEISGIELTISD